MWRTLLRQLFQMICQASATESFFKTSASIEYDRKPLIIGILFANEEKSCTFAPTVSATLPVEQRTRAELLLLYYDIFGNNSEPQGNLFFHP